MRSACASNCTRQHHDEQHELGSPAALSGGERLRPLAAGFGRVRPHCGPRGPISGVCAGQRSCRVTTTTSSGTEGRTHLRHAEPDLPDA